MVRAEGVAVRRCAVVAAVLLTLALAGCSWGPDEVAPTATATLKGSVVDQTPSEADSPTVSSPEAAAPCPLQREALEMALDLEITTVDHQTFRAADELLCTYLGTPYVVLEMYLLPDDGRSTIDVCRAPESAKRLDTVGAGADGVALVAYECPVGIEIRFTAGGYNVLMDAYAESSAANVAALADAAEEVANQLSQ